MDATSKRILKSSSTSLFAKQSLEEIILLAKHISMLAEVNSLSILHSSRGRIIVLKITELSNIYHNC